MKNYAVLFLLFMISSTCNAPPLYPYDEGVIKEYAKLLQFAIQRNDEFGVRDAIERSKRDGIINLSNMPYYGIPMFVWAAGVTPNTNILQMLLNNVEYLEDINEADPEGETALTNAIRSNPSVVPFLLQRGAQVNTMTHIGETPLTLAVIHRDIGVIKRLLDAGANPNLGGIVTPLSIALEANKKDIVLELIDRGADYQPYSYYPLVQEYMKAKAISPYELQQRELGVRFP